LKDGLTVAEPDFKLLRVNVHIKFRGVEINIHREYRMLTSWYLFLKCIRNGSMKHTISYVASIHEDPDPLGVIAHNRWWCQEPLDGDVVGAVFKELSVWETASQRSF
jgi:hypothetical protein